MLSSYSLARRKPLCPANISGGNLFRPADDIVRRNIIADAASTTELGAAT